MPVSNKILQVSYNFTMDTQVYTNQLHYEQDGGDALEFTLAGQGANVHQAAVALYTATLQNLQSIACVLTEIQYRMFGDTVFLPTIPPAPVLTPQTLHFTVAEEFASSTDLPEPGDVTGESLPSFNAFRARKITAAPGRRFRGHNSFPGVPESLSVGNVLDTSPWTSWQSEAVAMLMGTLTWVDALVTTYTLKPVVLSLTAAQAGNTASLAANTFARRITNVIPNRLIGTMVRRKKRTV